MAKQYKIQEFADLAGVTVKALLHYDRLGLLRPARTESGYRWEKHRKLYEEGPGPEWRDLYRDGAALLDADPSSDAAQSLAHR